MLIKKELLETLSKEELINIILEQAKRIKDLEKEVESLSQKINDLNKHIEELERISHRQAAPFRIPEKKRKQNCKKPGRPKGHKGAYRQVPDHIDEEVEAPLTHCPKCGGEVSNVKEVEQYIEEIPEIKPKVCKLVTYRGICEHCGEVQSNHPLKCSDATGAAKVQIGPNAKSIAMRLQFEYKLSKRKVVDIMESLFGISISAGGLTNASHTMRNRCECDYEELIKEAQKSYHIHSDETSWYVGGSAWLWVFTNPSVTIYKIADNRSRQVFYDVLGKSYPGILVSDCLNIYDAVNPIQQKCYSHHLKAISEAKEKCGDSEYLKLLEGLLRGAMVLKGSKGDMSAEQYQVFCCNLERKADELLKMERSDVIEEKVRNRLLKQRDHLFTFLYYDVDATNNLAERRLRPAVISRKISCGNKSMDGAHTWEVLTSLIVTYKQRGESVSEFFYKKSQFDSG